MEAYEIRFWEKGKWTVADDKERYVPECLTILQSLVDAAEVGICSYISEDKVISKAMFIAKKRNHNEFWFNTDSTAELSDAVRENKNFTLFIFDKEKVMSAMLTGMMEAERDPDIKKAVWKREFDEWYEDGMNSPEYMVIHFYAKECRFFHDGIRMELRG